MSWYAEQLHRDGSVMSRVPVAVAGDGSGALTIGRALDNGLVIDDAHCAAHHARLDISADGHARLIDLGTQNSIANARGKRAPVHEVTTDAPFRLGHSQIRVRSSEWPVAPEVPLSRRSVWPFALLGLIMVLAYEAWSVWLNDTSAQPPKYLYSLSGAAIAVCVWSAVYALLGRLISGVDRFFSHLVIASTGYLTGTFLLWLLATLSFAMSWLWPVRIHEAVVVLAMATTVRFHLRLADPRHWRHMRIVVALVAALAIIIPVVQQWLSYQRLTDVQTLTALRHPALRVADPVPLETFVEHGKALQAKVDKLRSKDNESDGADWTMTGDFD